MARKANKTTPLVMSGYLYTENPETTGIKLSEPAWYAWLLDAETFYFESWGNGNFSARKQAHRRGYFWYAYKRVGGRLVKRYLGDDKALTRDRLEAIAKDFAALVG